MNESIGMNEPIAAVIVGLLLSVSSGFRIMLPLLAVNWLLIMSSLCRKTWRGSARNPRSSFSP